MTVACKEVMMLNFHNSSRQNTTWQDHVTHWAEHRHRQIGIIFSMKKKCSHVNVETYHKIYLMELRAHFSFQIQTLSTYIKSEIKDSSPVFFVCNVLNEWEEALSLKEDIAFASLLI